MLKNIFKKNHAVALQFHGVNIPLSCNVQPNYLHALMESRIFIQFETTAEEKQKWADLAKAYAEKKGRRGTIADVVRIASSYGRLILERELEIQNQPTVIHLSRSQAGQVLAKHYLEKALALVDPDSITDINSLPVPSEAA